MSELVFFSCALIAPVLFWLGSRGFKLKSVGQTWIVAICLPFFGAPIIAILWDIFGVTGLTIKIGERLVYCDIEEFYIGLSKDWSCLNSARRLTNIIEQTILFAPMFGILWLLPRPPLVRVLHIVAMLPTFLIVRSVLSGFAILFSGEL
ncbi:hypothetical protein [Boseongicola aestuarii]|uniref:Uncharacterized protein n=1 Tax=Boseongicola aestuarii TaxID=1470561 RepID=A0A238J546_9RHOB|nr:hypothetical protein [Boseongicola aestuarii]SMX25828.1 hypothetical protein BOA8489_03973 [Boseongicola aestuarii]